MITTDWNECCCNPRASNDKALHAPCISIIGHESVMEGCPLKTTEKLFFASAKRTPCQIQEYVEQVLTGMMQVDFILCLLLSLLCHLCLYLTLCFGLAPQAARRSLPRRRPTQTCPYSSSTTTSKALSLSTSPSRPSSRQPMPRLLRCCFSQTASCISSFTKISSLCPSISSEAACFHSW